MVVTIGIVPEAECCPSSSFGFNTLIFFDKNPAQKTVVLKNTAPANEIDYGYSK